MMVRLFLAAWMAACLAYALPNSRPAYIDCVSTAECGTFECCSLGMGRFSVPTCKALREAGEACIPHTAPYRTNLSYPDGSEVALEDVYLNLCPCGPGLTCSSHGICAFDTAEPAHNYLYD